MTFANASAIRRALENAGVELIEENGAGPGARLKQRLQDRFRAGIPGLFRARRGDIADLADGRNEEAAAARHQRGDCLLARLQTRQARHALKGNEDGKNQKLQGTGAASRQARCKICGGASARGRRRDALRRRADWQDNPTRLHQGDRRL